jgi:hypothetical protein
VCTKTELGVNRAEYLLFKNALYFSLSKIDSTGPLTAPSS